MYGSRVIPITGYEFPPGELVPGNVVSRLEHKLPTEHNVHVGYVFNRRDIENTRRADRCDMAQNLSRIRTNARIR